jgi:hypothetical protein
MVIDRTFGVKKRLKRNWWRLLLITPAVAAGIPAMRVHPWLVLLFLLTIFAIAFEPGSAKE